MAALLDAAERLNITKLYRTTHDSTKPNQTKPNLTIRTYYRG